jgi:hypothetical protein
MWISLVSVTVAGLASFVIPLAVSASVRRNDRRRAERDPLSAQDPARVVVRSRTWQWVVWRLLGIVFIVVGGFFTLVSFVGADTMDGPGPAISAIAIFIAGCGALILASSLRRFRIVASPDGLVVRRGFREERTIPLTAIAAVHPLANAYGGVDARDTAGRRLFSVMGLSYGYAEFSEFLEARVVGPLREASATAVPPRSAVPAWRGSDLSADWTMLPLGSRRGPQPVVRIWSTTAGTAALHLDELRAVTSGEHGIAESLWSPEAYLCRPGSAARSSAAGTAMAGVPDHALVLLVGDLPRPAAVLHGAELESFSFWVNGLPSDCPPGNS